MSVLTDLQAAYRFHDEEDSHVYRYHLTENGTPTYASANGGYAASFDGSTDYLSLSTGINHAFQIGDVDWAISLWFKFEAGDVGSEVSVIGLENTDWLIQKRSNERIRFQVNKASGGAVNAEIAATHSSGTWYHVFAWFVASTQTIGIRVDDTSESTTSVTDDVSARSTTFRVGGHNTSSLMEGDIGEVWIYKGYIPSSSEITELYNSGSIYGYFEATGETETYYDLEDVYEKRGDRHDVLTEVGSPTYTTGKVGNGVELSGSSEYVSSDDHIYKYIEDEDFCGKLWIYPHALANDGLMGQDNNSYSLQLRSTGAIRFRLNTSGGAKTLDTTGTVAINTWSHISFYHDKTNNEMGVRINNGTAETLTTSGDTPEPRGTSWSLGSVGAGNYFDGLIDQANFRRGGLFSSTELSDDYNSGTGATFKSELELDYVDNSSARRVQLQAKAAQISGTGTVNASSWIIREGQLPAALIDSDESTAEVWGAPSLRFSKDEAGTDMIPLDITTFQPSSTGGTAELWTYTTDADATNGEDIYAWWGDATKSAAPRDSWLGSKRAHAVYRNVYNAKYDPTGNSGDVPDSTGTDDGTSIGTMGALVSGPGGIWKAFDFDASNDEIELSDFDVENNITVEFWANIPNTTTQYAIIGKHDGTGANQFVLLFSSAGSLASIVGASSLQNTGTSVTGDHHWYVTVEESSGDTIVKWYKDGVLDETQTHTGVTIGSVSGGRKWTWGQEWDGGARSDYFEDTLAAMRLRNDVDSEASDLALTQYNNQNDPETFWDHTFSVTTPTSGETGTVTDGADAGDTFAVTMAALAAITEGASAGETWATVITRAAAIIEGASAGDAFSAVTGAGETGALSDGADAGDTWLAVSAQLSSLSEGATATDVFTAVITGAATGAIAEGTDAGESFAASLAALASISEGAVAGDTWTATTGLSASVTEGASASDTFSYPSLGYITATINIYNAINGTINIKPD